MFESVHDPNPPVCQVLVELGHGDRRVALLRDEHPADPYLTRLGWRTGVARRVADDIETPAQAVGTLVERRIRVSGIETFLENRLTVLEAIDAYGALWVERVREILRKLRTRSEDPASCGGSIFSAYGRSFRDPESVTNDEGRQQAAEEIIRHSMDALFTLPALGTRTGLAARFCAELEEAAAAYPRVVFELLYEAGHELHGWPA
jgi:hypothetical protein